MAMTSLSRWATEAVASLPSTVTSALFTGSPFARRSLLVPVPSRHLPSARRPYQGRTAPRAGARRLRRTRDIRPFAPPREARKLDAADHDERARSMAGVDVAHEAGDRFRVRIRGHE